MKAYGGVVVYVHVFLTSAVVGGGWLASHPGHIIAGEGAHGTPRIGDWVGPGAGLDDVEKRKISDSDPLAVQPVAGRYNDCAIPSPSCQTSGTK
jgi:hypothetical protein